MESAEIILPFIFFARLIERDVLPTAVGPVKTTSGFFINTSYNTRLNFFSSSYFDIETIVGRP